jgi:hypothetical protein
VTVLSGNPDGVDPWQQLFTVPALYYTRLMLTPYRRHRKGCKRTSRRFKGCFCPMWAQGVLDGEPFRKSLGVTSWEAAQRKIQLLEIHGDDRCPTMDEACDRYLADCEARGLKFESLRKYKRFVKSLKEVFGNRLVRSISVDDLRNRA